MDKSTSIHFVRTLDGSIALRRIEWWRPTSRFVVVKYARHGEVQEFGKRLDLDKQVFLDSFDDESLDAKLKALVPDILQAVATCRSASRKRHHERLRLSEGTPP